MQQHGGRVELDSAPGVGSTVRVHLPGVEVDTTAPPSPATVLVVEEDRATADRLVEALAGRGYTMLSAAGAEEALAVAAGHPGPGLRTLFAGEPASEGRQRPAGLVAATRLGYSPPGTARPIRG